MDAKVSVIIVSFNSGTLLLECVQSALASSVAVEVIVSDNGSTDASIDALADMAGRDARLRVVRNELNLGFARGNNVVLPLARGEYVLFLNPDCLVRPDTLARVIAALERQPHAAMAGCLIRNPDGSEQAGCRRQIPTPRHTIIRTLHHFGISHPRLRDYVMVAEPLPTAPQAIEAISGAFMLIRHEALERVGSFDDRYFMHWEDLDLCLRFRRAGYGTLFVPDAEALHFKGRSSDQRPIRVEWHKHAGMVRFFRKFFLGSYLLPLLVPVAIAVWLRFLVRLVELMRVPPWPVPSPDNAAPDEADKEVWVFGATSLIGHHLLPRLVAAGYRVRAFSRAPERAGLVASTCLSWQRFDIEKQEELPDAGIPETVIHLAPLMLLPSQIETLARRGMRRVIGFGSTSRFTKRHSSQPREQKLVAELERAEQQIQNICERLHVDWAVFRPTLIYSFGRDRNVSLLAGFVRRFGFFLMPGEGRGLRQPVHADDLAQACITLLAGGRGWNRAYNLSGGETLTYRAMVQTIFRKLHRHEAILHLPTWCWRSLLRLAHMWPSYRWINLEMIQRVNVDMCFDHAEATREFGFAPRRFQL